MSGYQETFKRVEKKYLLDGEKYSALIGRLAEHAKADKYGETLVCSLYFDTADHRMIRRSMEKPIYKEKLRIRSYGVPNEDSLVFLELKKKYKGVVYKRRAVMTLAQAREFVRGGAPPGDNPQIEKELKWFMGYYPGIAPAMYLSYLRTAYEAEKDPGLRITFDRELTYRDSSLELEKGSWGGLLLPEGHRLMEIKIPGAMPLWLSRLLDEMKIYPGTFSKYAAAYTNTLKAQGGGINDQINDQINNKEKVNSCADDRKIC